VWAAACRRFASHPGPSVAPAGAPAMVWHLYRAIFTDLNTNGYCLIVSRFISQTSLAPAPAQLLQSKPLSLNRAAYCLPSPHPSIKRIDLWPSSLFQVCVGGGGEGGELRGFINTGSIRRGKEFFFFVMTSLGNFTVHLVEDLTSNETNDIIKTALWRVNG